MSGGVYAFIARQPILDRRQTLHGYELLSRSGPGETFFRGDPEQGTSKVIADSLRQWRSGPTNFPRKLS